MSNYDFKGVIQSISDASPSHLALVSFLVLPVVMNAWLETIAKAFPTITVCLKVVSLMALLVIYLLCLWWLVKENAKRKLLENRKDKIIAKIMSQGFTKIGFDKLDNIFTPSLSIEEITEVIGSFPKSLRFVRLKKKCIDTKVHLKDENGIKLYKPAVGLVSLKDDPEE